MSDSKKTAGLRLFLHYSVSSNAKTFVIFVKHIKKSHFRSSTSFKSLLNSLLFNYYMMAKDFIFRFFDCRLMYGLNSII